MKFKNKHASLLNILGAFLIFFSIYPDGRACLMMLGEPEPPKCLREE